MGLTAFNHARRLADLANLNATAIGLKTVSLDSTPKPPTEEAVASLEKSASNSPPTVSPALALINSATESEQLTPLPTVGKGAAKVIFSQRGENGYPSLDALPAAIFESPYRCDLEQIKAWEDSK